MIINIIVAIDENNGIGKDNKLLAHIPEDLKRFKEITEGHTVVMGYNTWLSLPKKPLPNRRNIVITSKDIKLEGAEVVHSIRELFNLTDNEKGHMFVIGGATLYKQMLPYAHHLYVTLIHETFEADTFFPKVIDEWCLSSIEECHTDKYKLEFFKFYNSSFA